jgi:hypothetical protein
MVARFARVFDNSGVDDVAAPNPWMIVPAEAYGRVLLKDGAGLTLKYDRSLVEVHELNDRAAAKRFGNAVFGRQWGSSPSASEMISHSTGSLVKNLKPWMDAARSSRSRLFVVKSKQIGSGRIQAVDTRNACKAVLGFSVKRCKTYRVAFHFVQFGRQKATRSPSQLHLTLARVNQIFSPQTNVQFRAISSRQVTVENPDAQVDGEEVRADIHARYFLSKRNRAADVNVFFVRDVKTERLSMSGTDPAGTYQHRNRIAFVEDELSPAGHVTLAHELGHFVLSTNGVVKGQQHTQSRHDLMYANVGSGLKISKNFANRMNV